MLFSFSEIPGGAIHSAYRLLFFFADIFCLPTASWCQQQTLESQAQTFPRGNDSDWWSITKGSQSFEGAKEQNRQISDKHFQILGVELDEGLLEDAGGKLGRAMVIRRGDGGDSRAQLCYVSKTGKTET